MALKEIIFTQHRNYNGRPVRAGQKLRVNEPVARALVEIGAAQYNPVQNTKVDGPAEFKEEQPNEEQTAEGLEAVIERGELTAMTHKQLDSFAENNGIPAEQYPKSGTKEEKVDALEAYFESIKTE